MEFTRELSLALGGFSSKNRGRGFGLAVVAGRSETGTPAPVQTRWAITVSNNCAHYVSADTFCIVYLSVYMHITHIMQRAIGALGVLVYVIRRTMNATARIDHSHGDVPHSKEKLGGLRASRTIYQHYDIYITD